MFEVYYSTIQCTAMCYRLKILVEKFQKATNQNVNSLQAILAIQYLLLEKILRPLQFYVIFLG